LFVLSTGIGISLLSESAYERYVQLEALRGVTLPASGTLPAGSVLLPSGEIVGNVATLPSLALVANAPNNERTPCDQVYAHHYLVTQNCADPGDPGTCPCAVDQATQGNRFCGVPAMVELAPTAGIPVLVVNDADATLQALTVELAPGEPQVDGILGTSALGAMELDIDYPDNRLLGRCVDHATCTTRPELVGPPGDYSAGERLQVQLCLGIPPTYDNRPPI
jgi:hypothetical protein